MASFGNNRRCLATTAHNRGFRRTPLTWLLWDTFYVFGNIVLSFLIDLRRPVLDTITNFNNDTFEKQTIELSFSTVFYCFFYLVQCMACCLSDTPNISGEGIYLTLINYLFTFRLKKNLLFDT